MSISSLSAFPLRALALACAVAAPLSAPAQSTGDPRPSLWDALTPDAIATALFNIGVTATRSVMEVRYDYLTSDIARGSFALAGLTLRPQLYYDQANQCEITVERATIGQSGGAFGLLLPIGTLSGTINLIGVEMTTACLDPEIADIARAIGLRQLVIDQAKLEIGYDVASGEAELALALSVDGLAQLDLRARGTYLTQTVNASSWPTPAVRLSEAVMTLKDRGGWARLATMLPGDMRDPQVIREIGTEALVDMLSQGPGGARLQLGANHRLFIDQVMARVAEYVANPGEITFEANLPPSGVVITEYSFQTPIDIVNVLALTARTAPAVRDRILSASDIRGASDGTPEMQLAMAQRLLEGDGVPRSTAVALSYARPLLADPALGAQAALLVGRATLDTDPSEAYAHALLAAAGDVGGAVALLDAAEARLTSGEVLALQDGIPDNAPLIATVVGQNDDPRALRQAALDRLYGAAAARSYAQAYYFAVLAEAAGDLAARSLIDDIEGRFVQRGAAAAAAWATARNAASEAALRDWITLDLPARYSTN